MDASHLRSLVGEWAERLSRVSEEDSLRVVGSAWTRKQLLGHLLDSACNNYQRFVRLRQGNLAGFPGYDQESWVAAGNYNQCRWKDLVELWRLYNLQLAALIENLPPGCEGNVWEGHEVSLGFLVQDFTSHMLHHLVRIP
jgi:hypothetical protein